MSCIFYLSKRCSKTPKEIQNTTNLKYEKLQEFCDVSDFPDFDYRRYPKWVNLFCQENFNQDLKPE